jgi:hypothetical protein
MKRGVLRVLSEAFLAGGDTQGFTLIDLIWLTHWAFLLFSPVQNDNFLC